MLSNQMASNNIEILPARTVSTTRQSQTKAVVWLFPARFQETEWGAAAETVNHTHLENENNPPLSPQALEKVRCVGLCRDYQQFDAGTENTQQRRILYKYKSQVSVSKRSE